jgi:hypothetical protein
MGSEVTGAAGRVLGRNLGSATPTPGHGPAAFELAAAAIYRPCP